MQIKVNLSPIEMEQAVMDYIEKHNPSFQGRLTDIVIIDDIAEVVIVEETTKPALATATAPVKRKRATRAEMAARRAAEATEAAPAAEVHVDKAPVDDKQLELPVTEEIADPDPEEDALLEGTPEKELADNSNLFGS